MTDHPAHSGDSFRSPPPVPRSHWWTALAQVAAATWAVTYLGLGVAWITGVPGNPADPAMDDGATLSLMGAWGPATGAVLLTGLAGLGVLLTAAMRLPPRAGGQVGPVHRGLTALAGSLGVILAVALPDYRLLASLAYTPVLLVLNLFGAAPDDVSLWPWPVVNQVVLTVAGLAWIVSAAAHYRRTAGAVPAPGRRDPAWARPDAAARWGRWATAVAVAVPLGYAATRYAWALGIPLGVSRHLLDDLGTGVYVGAGLATLGVGGAILTLGLVQRWGERFPRWMPGLSQRRVPIPLAVVPATIVSVAVTSAGLMFVRFGVIGEFGDTFPGENTDVAAWLPEMFWPLWGMALAAATCAYWLRRRAEDRRPRRPLSPGGGTPGPAP